MSEDADVDYMMVLQGEVRELRTENERLRGLVECLLDNEPDEPIADNGMTVLDGWRIEARRALGRLK